MIDYLVMRRIEHLTLLLQYDMYCCRVLTAFDRMFIHRERNAYIGDTDYRMDAELTAKTTRIISDIRRQGWECPDV